MIPTFFVKVNVKKKVYAGSDSALNLDPQH